MTYTAELVGGPCDGKIVKILGMNYIQPVASSYFDPPPWIEAIYEWDTKADGSYIGVFKGYFREGKLIAS